MILIAWNGIYHVTSKKYAKSVVKALKSFAGSKLTFLFIFLKIARVIDSIMCITLAHTSFHLPQGMCIMLAIAKFDWPVNAYFLYVYVTNCAWKDVSLKFI